ncbi:hypothetical protein EDD22DRAFT_952390 [Suillus occidentalis]|nr:hypothetical protein EDD22DRAFT_952390 [Suillus occidentalis]
MDVIHGDLTPSNILIDGDDKLCLVSFSLPMIPAESGNHTFNSCYGAKPKLSTAAEVRSLISLPLRGELTSPVPSLPAAPSSDNVNTDISGLLSQFVRLSSSPRNTDIPQIVIGEEAQDAAERASTEAAL